MKCAPGAMSLHRARLGISDAVRFLSHEGKVLLPFVAISGMGEGAAKSFADAYDKLPL